MTFTSHRRKWSAMAMRDFREAQGFGIVKPNSSLMSGTLVPPIALTPYDGNIVLNTDGDVVEGLWIRGFVDFRGDGQKLRNCFVDGVSNPSGGTRGIVHCRHTDGSPTNALIEDVWIRPRVPYIGHSGIIGHDYTAKRVRMSRTADGFDIQNDTNTTTANGPLNVAILGCWVEDMSKWYPDTYGRSPDGGHNDGIQVLNGIGDHNIWIKGNALFGRLSQVTGNTGGQNVGSNGLPLNPPTTVANSCIDIGPDVGPIGGIVVEDNWFAGGYIPVNARHPDLSGFIGTFRRNRFARDSYFYAQSQLGSFTSANNNAATFDWPITGPDVNYFEDTGEIVYPVRYP